MPPTCSARGCQNPASWSLLWNNPKLHPPERRKTWLACLDHRDSLGNFLRTRGFLRAVEPVDGPEENSATDR
ncbi:MAG: hypothetical protein M3393_02915 [Actinomycetota bacterium]|nr:hypothetical protein [Actinomycetota bacterium]